MIGIGPEGNLGAALEPVVAEPITLNPEQVSNLLSMYGNAILYYERAKDRGNFATEVQPASGRSAAQQEAISGCVGRVVAFEVVFETMGISDRARQIKDEVTLKEFERRFPEKAA